MKHHHPFCTAYIASYPLRDMLSLATPFPLLEPGPDYENWSSVTPLPMADVELTPPVTIFCSSST